MLTEQQLNDRLLGIGGSDMPIILGLSSYKIPYKLYLEKTGQISLDMEMTAPQYWGHRLEGTIREEFAKRNNLTVVQKETVVHPVYDFLRGNLDGWIPEHNAVLEIKCNSAFGARAWGESGSNHIPMPYLVQVAFYCALTNADCAYIAVLIDNSDYREYKYTRDLALEEALIEKAKAFWECVRSKTPPEPISQIDLRLMFPKHAPEQCKTIDTATARELTNLHEIRFKMKELTKLEDQYKFNIMRYMELTECLKDANNRTLATWKTNAKGSRTFLVKGVN